MITLNSLSIGYHHKRKPVSIFSDIHLSLNKGDLVGLMGDNGIGKSTLLKTITGSLDPLKGEININKKNILSYSAQELSQLISIVITEKVKGFNLRAWDVVASGRTPYLNIFAKLREEDTKIITQSLEQLSILHLKDKLMDELSDGQQQKVMIAKSLAQQTPIIILDEPTAFLDYKSKHQLFDILKELCVEQKKLIIVSSHDIDLMQRYITSSITLSENNMITIS